MKIHTGVRPHSCSICPKSFIQATQLRAHMFNHTGENGFACEICERSFSRKARLEAHLKKAHPDATTSDEEQQSDIKLPIAKKKRKTDDTVANSTTTTCDICYKTFKNLENLVRHMEAHRGIKSKHISILMYAIKWR